MTRPGPGAPHAPPPRNRNVEGESRRTTGDSRRAGGDFERLLRERTERGQRKQPDDEPGVIAAAVPCLVANVPGAAPTASSGPRGVPPATPQDPGPTRAALEAALGTPLATTGSIAAAGWEVSIPQPTGAPLVLRAGRLQQTDGSAAWSLDIRAKGHELQPALARAAARLTDRLEARALRARVRIDEDFEEDER